MLIEQILAKKFMLVGPEFSKFEHPLLDLTLLHKKGGQHLFLRNFDYYNNIKDLTRNLEKKPGLVVLVLLLVGNLDAGTLGLGGGEGREA